MGGGGGGLESRCVGRFYGADGAIYTILWLDRLSKHKCK